jgi:hypothetical protein
VLRLRYFIDNPSARKMWKARTEVITAVKEAFSEEGIKIPFPQRELSGREEAGGLAVSGVQRGAAGDGDDGERIERAEAAEAAGEADDEEGEDGGEDGEDGGEDGEDGGEEAEDDDGDEAADDGEEGAEE